MTGSLWTFLCLGAIANHSGQNDCQPRHVLRPSECPHWLARLPLDGFWWNFTLVIFPKICRRIPILVEVWQKEKADTSHEGLFTRVISHRAFFFLWRCGPTRAVASFLGFLDHTQRRTTVGRTPLDEWSARLRDHYGTTHNTQKRQTSMPRLDLNPQSQQTSGRRPPP